MTSPRRKPGSMNSRIPAPPHFWRTALLRGGFAGMTIIVELLFLSSCIYLRPEPVSLSVPSVPVSRYSALIRLDPSSLPKFEDDLDTASLRAAALRSLDYFKTLPSRELFVLGKDTYTAADLIDSMSLLAALLDHPSSDWAARLGASFIVYQSIGVDAEKTVVFSSYYEPTISARLEKDAVYRYPLYARPPDLVDVNLGLFDPVYQGARVAGRLEGRALVPYPTRSDIDSSGILKEKGLEIAWARNPVEILDLQIEGSGWLDISETRDEKRDTRIHRQQNSSLVSRPSTLLRIRYDGDNGRRYRSVGQYLISSGRIPAKKFSRQVFLHYLASHPKERQALLNVDERYIFFRIDTSTAAVNAYGNIEEALTAGRSIATDPKLFPKGALAWISTTGVHRFVLNQDEGGAIQGPGRVDVFAGHGDEAKEFATHLWNKGALYFLVKKKS